MKPLWLYFEQLGYFGVDCSLQYYLLWFAHYDFK